MSLQRRFGGGLLALGTGQLVLAAATAAEPGSVDVTTWLTGGLGVASLALGVLVASGRLPLDATGRQRRSLRVIATASLVGGVGVATVGLFLLVEHVLA